MNYELEESQIVLCTVDKIIGTTVFVRIEGNGEGTITTSEIAAGRIRNLRDYVSPGRKIVCKILKIQGDRIHLSLRRVKQYEKKELLDRLSKEKSYLAILKTVLGESSDYIIEKIKEKYSITDFFEDLRENKNLIKEYIDEENAQKIIKIIESKKEKEKELKQNFKLSNKSGRGIVIIKDILLSSDSKSEINYIAAGRYRITIKGEEFKELKNQLNKLIENIETQAKKNKCFFEIEKS
ncbi:hypothetical protein J4221_07385 [Candidatus Pacearchaeota archaeon]|nr:hypothetical protein [Candidatus Pacearchaeota archaeon]